MDLRRRLVCSVIILLYIMITPQIKTDMIILKLNFMTPRDSACSTLIWYGNTGQRMCFTSLISITFRASTTYFRLYHWLFCVARQQFLFAFPGIAHVKFATKLAVLTCFAKLAEHFALWPSAGYGKMPEYEHIFIDFLLSLVQNKCKKKDGT
jgi:hypothetical protein